MKHKIFQKIVLAVTALLVTTGCLLTLAPAHSQAGFFHPVSPFPSNSNNSSKKPAIPLGCPGSSSIGPPAPAGNGQTICDKIPAGCPGSSHKGKAKSASQCPYAPASSSSSSGSSSGNSNNSSKSDSGSKSDTNSSSSSSSSGGSGQGGSDSKGANGQADTTNDCSDAKSAKCRYHDQSQCDPTTDATCAYCSGGGNGCLSGGKDSASDPNANCNLNGCNLIKKYINPAINVLSAMIGLVAVISIISGGIQYATSTGDPQKTSAARNRISKTVMALVAYAFLYAFLEFLIPGGIFH
jgi:hypothetical protein